MNLPRLMVITEYSLMRPSYEEALRAALHGGARLIQLREKNADAPEVLRLARIAQKICKPQGAQLLINGNSEIAGQCGAAGIHLPEKESIENTRRTLGPEYSLGQSVHSVTSAREAEEQGAEYLIVGSVFSTATHPQSTPAGLAALQEISMSVNIPVYAVGGINSGNARQCRQAGAYGLAVIRAVWDVPDVELAVQALCEIVDE